MAGWARLWPGLVFVAAAGLGLALWRGGMVGHGAGHGPAEAPAAGSVAAASAPADDPALAGIGGDFTLQGAAGPVSSQSLRGKFVLIYFGYTHCPDVCPTTLSNIAAAMDAWAPARQQKLRVVFVSIDPERDTPRIAGDYAAAFGPAFLGLSGSTADIAAMAQAYHVYYAKLPQPGGGYAMEHSSVLYLLRPDGALAGFVPADLTPERLGARLAEFGV